MYRVLTQVLKKEKTLINKMACKYIGKNNSTKQTLPIG